MTVQPLVALISATSAAIGPAQSAVRDVIPGVRIWNILDDRLLSDAEAAGGVDDRLRDRMRRLIEHATREGADAVVLTCSQYGQVAIDSDSRVPVLAADAAAFEVVLAGEHHRVLVLASLHSAAVDTVSRLTITAAGRNRYPKIRYEVPEGAAEAARDSDAARLVDVLERAVHATAEAPDVVLLAQYSLEAAAASLAHRLTMPVVSGASTVGDQLARRLRMIAS